MVYVRWRCATVSIDARRGAELVPIGATFTVSRELSLVSNEGTCALAAGDMRLADGRVQSSLRTFRRQWFNVTIPSMGRASEAMGVVGVSRSRALRISRAALVLCVLAGLGGCTSFASLWNTRDFAQGLAEAQGFEMEAIEAGAFTLTIFHKGLDEPSGTLAVYIEGDGRAWIAPTVVSRDPTPRDPIGLRLAVLDQRRSVLYVARPCQYTRGDPNCQPKYWSSHRFAEEVVEATDTAITRVLARSGPRAVGLVGYSGGGAVAALVAARRTDVAWLVTIAGNLDHESWTRHHGVSPLEGSLNPRDFARELSALPQLHWVGERDVVVPPAIARSYASGLAHSRNPRVEVVPGYGHDCCWVETWPEMLCRQDFGGVSGCE